MTDDATNTLQVIDGLSTIITDFDKQSPQRKYETILTITTVSRISGESARSLLQRMFQTDEWREVDLPCQVEGNDDGELVVTKTKRASTFAEFLTYFPDLSAAERSLLASQETLTVTVNPSAANLSFGVMQAIAGPVKALAAIDPDAASDIIDEISGNPHTVRSAGEKARSALQNAISPQNATDEKHTINYNMNGDKVTINGEIPANVWYALLATLTKYPNILCEQV